MLFLGTYQYMFSGTALLVLWHAFCILVSWLVGSLIVLCVLCVLLFWLVLLFVATQQVRGQLTRRHPFVEETP